MTSYIVIKIVTMNDNVIIEILGLFWISSMIGIFCFGILQLDKYLIYLILLTGILQPHIKFDL